MLRHRSFAVLFFALLLGVGCGRLEGDTSAIAPAGESSIADHHDDLTVQTLRELASLERVVTSGSFPFIVLVLVAVGAGWIWISRLLRRWQRRRGLNVKRLTVITFTVQIVGALVAAVIVFRALFDKVPVLSGVALMVGGIVLIAIVGRDVPSWFAGIGLILQRGVNEGDRVTAADVDGVVERIGLLRLLLRRSDGGLTHVTISTLGRDIVTVASPQRAHPVVVRVHHDQPPTFQERQRIAAIAALCPFRTGEGEVRLSTPRDDDSTTVIELRAWSSDAAREAEAFLLRALDDLRRERLHEARQGL